MKCIKCIKCDKEADGKSKLGALKGPWICKDCSEEMCEGSADQRGTANKSVTKLMQKMISHAKERGKYAVNITIEDVIDVWPEDGMCPVLKVPFGKTDGKTGNRSKAPSIDRIDNNRGYEPDNIQIISTLANKMKQNASPEELLKFATWVMKEKEV